MALDVKAAKKRLIAMGAINGVAVVGAMAALVGYFRFHLDWALGAFAALMLVGIGAQIWFIAGVARANKGA